MKFKVCSRSNNRNLFDRMREFIPPSVEVIECINFNIWHQASDYLYAIINHEDADWIINIDIDCYVYDWIKVIQLMEYMAANDYTHCGMPDGGIHPGRTNSWATMNPFFNIFNAKKIRQLKENENLSWEQIQNHIFFPDWEKQKPQWVTTPYNHNNSEPFHGLFYWLCQVGTPLFLKPSVLDDRVTNHLADCMLHTWYSREYGNNPTSTGRLDYWYGVARKLAAVKKRGCIIVPYRDRKAHLEQFIAHIKHYYNIPVYVVEQMDQMAFNRGKLLNVGYLETKDKFDYHIQHDVDMLGDHADYSFCALPTHLASAASQFGYQLPYNEYFGGVVCMPNEYFEFVNGYPNSLTGWGAEDDVLLQSFLIKGILPKRKKCKFNCLTHGHNIDPLQYQSNLEKLKKGRDFNDGLNTCNYKATVEQKDGYVLIKAYF